MKKPKATARATNAVYRELSNSFGTHEMTLAKVYGIPRAEVDETVAAMLKDKTLVRIATDVLFFSKTHFDRIEADYKASLAADQITVRCCSEPTVRGGRCGNCGTWTEEVVCV